MNNRDTVPKPVLGLGNNNTPPAAKRKRTLAISRVAFLCGIIPVAAMTLFIAVILAAKFTHNDTHLSRFLYLRSTGKVMDVVLEVCIACMGFSLILGTATCRTRLGKMAIASPFVVVLLCLILKIINGIDG